MPHATAIREQLNMPPNFINCQRTLCPKSIVDVSAIINVVGLGVFGDAATSLRIASAGLIIAGVVGLKFA